jgi:glycosyltransferase involved in cell wall biosynthesis
MNTEKKSGYILWLPSWYPCKLAPYDGDFIQRHALALSAFIPVHVIHIIRDKESKITRDMEITENKTGELTETIIYYSIKNYSSSIVDKIVSIWKFHNIFRQVLKKYFLNNGWPSAVHVHVAYKAGLIAWWLRKKFKLEYFVTEHWTGYDRDMPGNYFTMPVALRYVIRKIFVNAKMVIPVSMDLGKKIAAIAPSVLLHSIPNVVDQRLFYFQQNKNLVFRFIHNASILKEQKNTEGLLSVLSQLSRMKTGWDCIIYGPVTKEIMELSHQSGLKDIVKFTGLIPYSEVAEIVRTATAYVSFSNYENQPCSILEALCCGVPVIATRVGGIPEIINSRNGLLISPGNESELLQAMNKMLDNISDFDNSKIAEDAKSRFSYEAVGKELLSLYKS